MTVTCLFPSLPFIADETPWSWAARLAAFHTRGLVDTFLRDLGLDTFALSLGEREEVARLCAIAGQDPQPVLRNTLSQHIRRVHRLGPEFLEDSVSKAGEIRFCPACLAVDDAEAAKHGQHIAVHRRERLIWRLNPIRSCPSHEIALISRARPTSKDARGVFGDNVVETGVALNVLAVAATRLKRSPLQTYVIARIAGQSGPVWLENQRLEDAIRSTELLGAALEFGKHVSLEDLSDAERLDAAIAGWEYTSQGESGVARALSILTSDANAGQMARVRQRTIFGALGNELDSPARGSPLANLMREHLANLAKVN